MKIDWAENPLATVIELDESEKATFRLKVFTEYAEDGDDGPSEEWRREIAEHYIDGALQGSHVGDCTCIACTCSKCCAEELLGIDTIKGLGKHEAHAISRAFGSGRDINGAIEYLRAHDPDDDGDNPSSWKKKDPKGWAKWVPVWREQQARALKWLIAYRDEHFSRPTPVAGGGREDKEK